MVDITSEIKVSKGDTYISCYYNEGVKGAVAEMSLLGDNTWYFNRLYVHAGMRGRGISKVLLGELMKIVDEKKGKVICDVNPYGDLDRDALVKLYKSFGFVEGEGFLVRENSRD